MKPGSKPSWLGCSLQNLATRFTQESSLEPPRICAGIAAEAHRLRQSCLDSTSPDDDAAAKSVCGIMDQNRVEKLPYRMKLTPTRLLSFNTLRVSSLKVCKPFLSSKLIWDCMKYCEKLDAKNDGKAQFWFYLYKLLNTFLHLWHVLWIQISMQQTHILALLPQEQFLCPRSARSHVFSGTIEYYTTTYHDYNI